MEPAAQRTLEQTDRESKCAPISNRSEKLGPCEERIGPEVPGVVQDRTLQFLVPAKSSHPA